MINASLIKSKFLRSRPKLHFTKSWSETANHIKQIILEDIKLRTGEEPVINFYKDKQHWWLLSNNSLYIRNFVIDEYEFRDFKEIEPPQNFYQGVNVEESSAVQVIAEDSYIQLVIEPASWAIVYSILKFVMSHSK